RRLRQTGSGSALGSSRWISGGGHGSMLVLHSSSPARGVPYRGLGYSDAVISSAVSHRAGILVDKGTVGVGELVLWTGVGPIALSGSVRSRAGAGDPFADASGRAVSLHTLSARLVLGNAALTVGREQQHWAPGVEGGLTLSATARPVDQV